MSPTVTESLPRAWGTPGTGVGRSLFVMSGGSATI